MLALQFAPSALIHLENFVSTDDRVPPSIGIKPNFITVPYLSGSWLNIIEVRRDDIFLQKKVDCFHRYPVGLQVLYLLFYLFPVLVCL